MTSSERLGTTQTHPQSSESQLQPCLLWNANSAWPRAALTVALPSSSQSVHFPDPLGGVSTETILIQYTAQVSLRGAAYLLFYAAP